MPVLGPEHDLAHPVEGDTAWSESYYFNCYDPDADTGFYTRVGVRPNEGTIDVGLAFWVPGRRPRPACATAASSTRWSTPARGRAGHVRAASSRRSGGGSPCDGESTRRGRLAMDVTFDALTPPIGGDGQGAEAADASSAATRQSVGKGHLEQAGRWSGWIEIGGDRHELGPTRPRQPRQVVGPAPLGRAEDVALVLDQHRRATRTSAASCIGTPDGDLHRGWVWRDGEHASIAEWKVTSELADDGVTHTQVATSPPSTRPAAPTSWKPTSSASSPAPAGIQPSTTIVNEGLARWTYEGRTGTGISEYLHQLDADARPVVPIA